MLRGPSFIALTPSGHRAPRAGPPCLPVCNQHPPRRPQGSVLPAASLAGQRAPCSPLLPAQHLAASRPLLVPLPLPSDLRALCRLGVPSSSALPCPQLNPARSFSRWIFAEGSTQKITLLIKPNNPPGLVVALRNLVSLWLVTVDIPRFP